MWMIGARPGTGYSCTMANDGDATSAGFAPSSAAIARTRNVLPAPRSPMRWTTASAPSVRAISRPAAAVSDSSRQRYVCIALIVGCYHSAMRRLIVMSLLAVAGVAPRTKTAKEIVAVAYNLTIYHRVSEAEWSREVLPLIHQTAEPRQVALAVAAELSGDERAIVLADALRNAPD